MRWVKVATEMSSLVSMLFRTFLNPLKFLMEIIHISIKFALYIRIGVHSSVKCSLGSTCMYIYIYIYIYFQFSLISAWKKQLYYRTYHIEIACKIPINMHV